METNRHGAGEAQRVVLVTSEGHVPLATHYSGTDPHEKTAEAIRVWLRDHGADELPI